VGLAAEDLIPVGVLASEGALLASAWRPCRSNPSFYLFRWLIFFALADDFLGTLCNVFVFADAPKPLAGLARVLYHGCTLFTFGWPCAVLTLALWTFAGRRANQALDVVMGLWLGLVASTICFFPVARLMNRRLHHGTELLCAGGTALVAYLSRRARWGRLHTTMLLLAGGEFVIAVVGPYATDPFKSWEVASGIYIVEFLGLALWWRSFR
jgi:uncharacterized membrane protein HdeD (DUF308 family)